MLNKKYLEIVKKPEELFDLLLAKSKNIKAKTKGEIFGRGVAIFASFAGKFTSFVTRHALFDNKIIEKFNQLISDMKKSNSTSKIKQSLRNFVKNNPTFFAVFFYWLILTAGIGGVKVAKDFDNIKSNIESFIKEHKNKKSNRRQYINPDEI
ncbi:MAG: hypothetical protein MJ158_00435 [Alphaproteobacteria bacterium]|nr:hypothetical protein [Alphaproteobacteria bacterium]